MASCGLCLSVCVRVCVCARINLRVETFCRQAQHKYFKIKSGGAEEEAAAYLCCVFPLPHSSSTPYLFNVATGGVENASKATARKEGGIIKSLQRENRQATLQKMLVEGPFHTLTTYLTLQFVGTCKLPDCLGRGMLTER